MARTKKVKNIPPVEMEVIPLEPAPLTPIEDLLADPIRMREATDRAEAGFSMSSIASSIGISAVTFTNWIRKGKALQEEEPNRPEVLLWQTMSKAWSTARGLAEAKLAERDPAYYLTHGPAKLLGDDWIEEEATGVESKKETLEVTTDFIIALKKLREQGIDLNTIIDNDMLSIKTEHTQVEDKGNTLLEQYGMIEPPKSLPGPLATQTFELHNVLLKDQGK